MELDIPIHIPILELEKQVNLLLDIVNDDRKLTDAIKQLWEAYPKENDTLPRGLG